jgi:signal transduction histidine kinase
MPNQEVQLQIVAPDVAVSSDAATPSPRQGVRARVRTVVTRRVGFWRALAEMFALGLLLSALVYPLNWLFGPRLAEVATLLIYPAMAYSAWRLAAGTGPTWRRALRVLAWCTLYSVISSVTGWVQIQLFPYQTKFFGIRPESLQISLPMYILSFLFLSYSIILPTRLLITLWMAARRRLRWLLVYSYVLVGVLTIVIVPVTYGLFIGVSSLFYAPVFTAPQLSAQRLAQALEPTVRRDVSPGELNDLLANVLAGRAQLPMPVDGLREEVENFNDFTSVRRITLVRADGVVLASAGTQPFAAGDLLPEVERTNWRLMVDEATSAGCIIARPVDGPLPDSAACPIFAENGEPLAVVITENLTDATAQWGASIGRIIGIVFAGTSFSLTLALPIIAVLLLVAFGLGLVIARRLTRRIELLAVATGDVAAGNLGRRVEVDRQDEIGRLGVDFNAMAERLEQRERALANEASRAEAALAANRRLAANVSHELRTPLTTLRGYVEALQQDYADKLPTHDLSVIHGEVQRLTTMIEDLFTLARAEAQQLPLTIETVDAGALARRIAATLAPLARRDRQIELVVALPDDLPPVRADKNRLEQVLLNLAQNALRHTPPGGIIAFEGAAHDSYVALTVADTGVGIEPDELPLVFERFYRGDESRARETGGAGLGLALVRELVTAMGGTISAESIPGRGSRFTVELQQAPAQSVV